MTLKDLATSYVLARRQKEFWVSEAERLHKDLALAMETEKLDRISCEVDDKGVRNQVTVSLTEPKLYASVAQENFLKLTRWLKKMKLNGIIRRGVHPATLSSTIGEEVRKGTPIPEFISVAYRPGLLVKGVSSGAR